MIIRSVLCVKIQNELKSILSKCLLQSLPILVHLKRGIADLSNENEVFPDP